MGSDKTGIINELLNRIKQNDLAALGELMELKTPAIRTIARNVLRDEKLAEDIVDEVMIALIKNIHNFKNSKNINGWINAAAINLSIDYLRKTKREKPFSEEPVSERQGGSDENDIIERLTVVSILEKMDSMCSSLLVDKYINGLKLYELSDKYGLTVKQVRTRLAKAKEIFIQMYK